MGNSQHSLLRDAEWDIRAIKQKKDWSNLPVDDFFSTDFLDLNFRGNLVHRSGPSAESSLDRGPIPFTSYSRNGVSLDDLDSRLRASCHSDGLFTVQLLQRMHVLEWIQDALREKFPVALRKPEHDNSGVKEIGRARNEEASSSDVNSGGFLQGHTFAHSSSRALVTELLSTMVTAIQDEPAERQSEFLQEISPLLNELPPLCLVDSNDRPEQESATSSGQAASARRTRSSVGTDAAMPDSSALMDTLRDFLFLAATQLPSTSANNHNRGPVTRSGSVRHHQQHQEPGTGLSPDQVPLLMKTRQTSLAAIVALSLARGSLLDLLLSVRALFLASEPVYVDVPVHRDDSNEDLQRRLAASFPSSLVSVLGGLSLVGDDGAVEIDTTRETSSTKARAFATLLHSKAAKIAAAAAAGSGEAVAVSVGSDYPQHSGRSPDVFPAHDNDEWEVEGAATMLLGGGSEGFERGHSAYDPRSGALSVPGSSSIDVPSVHTIQVSLPSVAIVPHLHYIANMNTPALMKLGRGAKVDGAFMGLQSEACEVWTCGQNSYGELAHGDTKSRSLLTKVETLSGCDVAQVAAGNEHTVILLHNGEVLTAGYNDNGQCGQKRSLSRISQLSRVEKLLAYKVDQIHAYNGCEHTIVVDNNGLLLSFGYNYRGQLGLGHTTNQPEPHEMAFSLKCPVRLVACSYYHSVIVCQNRNATYAFGRNDFGQLGIGDTHDKSQPQRLHALDGQCITSLACGQYHTVLSTKRGRIYSCGKNDYGQLGLRADSNCIVPALVDQGILRGMSAIDVKCGYYHTIVLCHSSSIVGFGRNDYGQLGLGHTSPRVSDPQVVSSLEGRNIAQVTAGCYHTIAVGKGGRIFVFGRNNHGQLGTGDTNERHVPFEVRTLLGKNILAVAAGFYHSIVLVGNPKRRPANRHRKSNSVVAKDRSVTGAAGAANVVQHLDSDPESFSIHEVLDRQEFQLPPPFSPTPNSGHISASGTNAAKPSGLTGERSAPASSASTTTTAAPPLTSVVESKISSSSSRRNAGPNSSPRPMPSSMPGSSTAQSGGVQAGKPGRVPSQIFAGTGAILLLAHLHRLADSILTYLDSGSHSQPGLNNNTTTAPIDSLDELRAPFCIDMNPQVFVQLMYLIRLASSRKIPVAPPASARDGSNASPHIILACLKLVRLNLSARQKVQNFMKRSCSEQRRGQNGDRAAKRVADTATVLPGPASTCDTQLPPDAQHTLDSSLRTKLHACIFDLIQNPPSCLSAIGARWVRREAIRVLMAGLEFFYPSPHQQLLLVAKIVASSDVSRHSPDAVHTGSVEGDAGACLPDVDTEKVRMYLMGPILQRLASNDEVLSQLVRAAMESEDHVVLLRHVVKALVSHLRKFWLKHVRSEPRQDERSSSSSKASGGDSRSATISASPTADSVGGAKSGAPPAVPNLGNFSSTVHERAASADDLEDEVGDDDVVDEDSYSARLRLYRQQRVFLSAIQRHILSQAGRFSLRNCATLVLDDRAGYVRPATGRVDDDTCHDAASSNSAFKCKMNCEVCLLQQDPATIAWMCLKTYVEVVLRSAVSTLDSIRSICSGDSSSGDHAGVRSVSNGASSPGANNNRNNNQGHGIGGRQHTSGATENVRPSAGHTKVTKQSLRSLTLPQIKQSWIGKVLPVLVSGLLLFATNSHLAVSLVPYVADLLRVLNRICAQSPQVVYRAAAAEAINSPRQLQALHSGDGNAAAVAAAAAAAGGATGSATQAAAAAGANGIFINDDTLDEGASLSIPWLVQLTKTTALLAGQLASTITEGTSIYASTGAIARVRRSPRLSMYLGGALFRNGLRPDVVAMYGHHVDFNTCFASRFFVEGSGGSNGERRPVSTPHRDQSRSRHNTPVAGGSRACAGHYCRFAASDILESIRNTPFLDPSAKALENEQSHRPLLFQWLRDTVCRSNLGYQLAFRRCSTAADRQAAKAIHEVECAVLASLVYHLQFEGNFQLWEAHLDPERFKIVQSNATRPPHFLLQLWEFVAKITRSLDKKRSALELHEPRSEVGFLDYCKSVKQKVHMVLLVDPVSASASFINARDTIHNQKRTAARSRTPSFDARRRWSLLRCVVQCVQQWRATVSFQLLTSSEARSESVAFGAFFDEYLRFLQNDETSGIDLQSTSKNVLVQTTQQLSDLVVNLADNARRAQWRSIGFHIFRNLLASVSFPSIQADVLRGLPLALTFRQRQPQTGHRDSASKVAVRDSSVLGHLHGIGGPRIEAVRHTFHRLYRVLNTMLQELSIVHWPSSSCQSPWNPSNNSSSMNEADAVSTGPQVHPGNYLLMSIVVRCWALRFENTDLDFISSVRIFDILEHLLGKLDTLLLHNALHQPNDLSAASSSVEKSVRRAQRTLWFLFEYVAMQIVANATTHPTLAPDHLAHVNAIWRVFLRLASKTLYLAAASNSSSNTDDVPRGSPRMAILLRKRHHQLLQEQEGDRPPVWQPLQVFHCSLSSASTSEAVSKVLPHAACTIDFWFCPAASPCEADKPVAGVPETAASVRHILSVQQHAPARPASSSTLTFQVHLLFDVTRKELQVWTQSAQAGVLTAARMLPSTGQCYVDVLTWSRVAVTVELKPSGFHICVYINGRKCLNKHDMVCSSAAALKSSLGPLSSGQGISGSVAVDASSTLPVPGPASPLIKVPIRVSFGGPSTVNVVGTQSQAVVQPLLPVNALLVAARLTDRVLSADESKELHCSDSDGAGRTDGRHAAFANPNLNGGIQVSSNMSLAVVSMLRQLASREHSCRMLCSMDWVAHFVHLVVFGLRSTKVVALDILGYVLPMMDAPIIDSDQFMLPSTLLLLFRDQSAVSGFVCARQRAGSPIKFVESLLLLAGCLLWRLDPVCTFVDTLDAAMVTAAAQAAASCPPSTSAKYEHSVPGASPGHFILPVVRSLLNLIRKLAMSAKWTKCIKQVLFNSLKCLGSYVNPAPLDVRPTHTTTTVEASSGQPSAEVFELAMGLAALEVLTGWGGPSDVRSTEAAMANERCTGGSGSNEPVRSTTHPDPMEEVLEAETKRHGDRTAACPRPKPVLSTANLLEQEAEESGLVMSEGLLTALLSDTTTSSPETLSNVDTHGDLTVLVQQLIHMSILHNSALPSVRVNSVASEEAKIGSSESQSLRRPTLLHAVLVRHVKTQLVLLCKQLLTSTSPNLRRSWFLNLHSAEPALWQRLVGISNSPVLFGGFLTVDRCKVFVDNDRLHLHDAQYRQIQALTQVRGDRRSVVESSQPDGSTLAAPIFLYSTIKIGDPQDHAVAEAKDQGAEASCSRVRFNCPYCTDDNNTSNAGSFTERELIEHVLVDHSDAESEGREVLCPICVHANQEALISSASSVGDPPAVVPLYDFEAHLQLRHIDVGRATTVGDDHDGIDTRSRAVVRLSENEDDDARGDDADSDRKLNGNVDEAEDEGDEDDDEDEDDDQAAADDAELDDGEDDDEDEDGMLMDMVDPKELQYMIDELTSMGFPELWCTAALKKNGCDVAAASAWIVDNLEMLSTLEDDHLESSANLEADDMDRSNCAADSKRGSASSVGGDDDSDSEDVVDPECGRTAVDKLAAEDGEPPSIFYDGFYPDIDGPSGAGQPSRMSAGVSEGGGEFFGSTAALETYPLHGSYSRSKNGSSNRRQLPSRADERQQDHDDAHSQGLITMHQREEAISILYSREIILGLLCECERAPELVDIFTAQSAMSSTSQPLVGFEAMFKFLQLVLFRGYNLSGDLHHYLHCKLPGQEVLAAVPRLEKDFDSVGCLEDASSSALHVCLVSTRQPAFPRQPQAFVEHPKQSSAKGTHPRQSKACNGYDPADPASHHTWLQGIVWATLFAISSRVPHFLEFLAEKSLAVLESAAASSKHRLTKWHARHLACGDSAATTDPSVELAEWLLRLVVSRATFSATPGVAQDSSICTVLESTGSMLSLPFACRVAQCMYVGNVGLKQSAATVLTWLLMYLHQRESREHTATSEDPASTGENQITSIAQLVDELVPLDLIARVVKRRIRREKLLGRIFYSSYLRAFLSLFSIVYNINIGRVTANKRGAESAAKLSFVAPAVAAKRHEHTNASLLCASAEEGGEYLPEVGAHTSEVVLKHFISPVQLEERYATRVGLAWHVYWPDDVSVPRNFVFVVELRRSAGLVLETPDELGSVDGGAHIDGTFRAVYQGRQCYCSVTGLQSDTLYDCRVRVRVLGDSDAGGSLVSTSSGDLGECVCSDVAFEVTRQQQDFHPGMYKSVISQIRTGREIPFVFDSSECGPGIRISDDSMSAEFASNEMWSTILGSTGFVSGSNRWAVRIDHSATAYIFIGVATKDADLCNFLGSDQHGWGFIGDRALYHQRSKVSLYGERRFAQGDTIGVTLVRVGLRCFAA